MLDRTPDWWNTLHIWHHLLLKLLHQQLVTLLNWQRRTCLLLYLHLLLPCWPELVKLRNCSNSSNSQNSSKNEHYCNWNHLVYHSICLSDCCPNIKEGNCKNSNFIEERSFPWMQRVRLLKEDKNGLNGKDNRDSYGWDETRTKRDNDGRGE